MFLDFTIERPAIGKRIAHACSLHQVCHHPKAKHVLIAFKLLMLK